MRFLLALSILACTSAIAEDQPYDIQIGCAGQDIIVQVAMAKPGLLTFKVNRDYCGKDV